MNVNLESSLSRLGNVKRWVPAQIGPMSIWKPCVHIWAIRGIWSGRARSQLYRAGIHEPVGRIWSENFRFSLVLVRSDPRNDRLRCVNFCSWQFWKKNGQDNLSPFDLLKSHLFFAFMANQCIFPWVLKSKGTKDYRTSDDLRRDDLEGHEI